MSKRRSPIRSVLAERRMFANGGLLATDQGQNKAAGILASSAPMIEAVSQEILAPMTGGAMPMAQGGVAKFQDGGLNIRQETSDRYGREMRSQYGIRQVRKGLDTLQIPSLTPTQTVGPVGVWEAVYDPNNPVTMDFGSILRETGADNANRIFPLYGSTSATFSEALGPEFEKRSLAGDPYSRATEFASETLWDARAIAQEALGSLSGAAEAIFGYLFSGEDRTQGNLLNVMMIEGMLDTRPELKQDVLAMAKSIVAANPEIGPEDLRNAISKEISQKYEVAPIFSGQGVHLRDQGRVSRQTTEDPDRVQDLGTDEAQYQQGVVVEAEKMRMAMAKSPEAYREYMVEFSQNPSDTFKRDVQASVGDFGVTEAVAPWGQIAPRVVAETLMEEAVPTEPTIVAPEPEYDAFGNIVTTEEDDLPPLSDPSSYSVDLDAERRREQDAAAQIDILAQPEEAVMETGVDPSKREEVLALTPKHEASIAAIIDAANTDDQEDVNTNIQTYIDEFTSAIPDYEGKSESEKGWDIVKMGMAIAAGQSPNAITNIANGVLATIDNFTDDEKERRAYKRQVGLSAAKYAVEKVNADRDKLEAFVLSEKEMVHVMNPETGDLKTITKADLRAGNIPTGYLPTSDPYQNLIDGIDATRKLLVARAALEGKGEITSKWLAVGGTYTKSAQKLLDSYQSKTLLGPAIEILFNPDLDVTGAQGVLQTSWNRLQNAFGIEDESVAAKAGELREEYIARVGMVIAKKITAILGESNRTISNPDRDRADDLAGIFSDYLWDPTFTDPDILKLKIQNLWTTLEQDEALGRADMQRIEASVGLLTTPGTDVLYRDVLRRSGETVLGTRMGLSADNRIIPLSEIYNIATGEMIQ